MTALTLDPDPSFRTARASTEVDRLALSTRLVACTDHDPVQSASEKTNGSLERLRYTVPSK